jgi:hypothetical protein
VRNDIANNELSRTARLAGGAATGAFVLMIRACALVQSALAIGCFLVAVLFGFIFHAPLPHRWYVLGASAFKLLERKRRFKPQTIEIAKRRILRREPATALAAEYGVNLQRIYTRTLLNPI